VHRDLDLRIIEGLRQDGQVSLNQLGRMLGVSTTTVSNRLKRLLEEGIIRRFKPELDYECLGYGLTAELARHGCFTHIYEVTGPFDLWLIGKFRDREELHGELDRLLGDPAVQDTETTIVLKIIREEADLPLPLGGLDSVRL
jgi:DNA-binding Lrp family transcriptional regulator